jgi:hypothetical protein
MAYGGSKAVCAAKDMPQTRSRSVPIIIEHLGKFFFKKKGKKKERKKKEKRKRRARKEK